MKKQIVLTLILTTLFALSLGCSSVGPRKYVLFGEPKAQKVEIFEDFWSDYPFKPDDPSLPLRRGKGGVIRFFKKNSYTRSILVDGDLTVNVYYSVKEGVTLEQPDSQLVLTSEELNKEHRKFDKETGYSYHVYLDLGLYDQPEKEITILSIFKDAKTGQATVSKAIRTTAMGSSPLEPEKTEREESEAERWARKKLGEDVENPIAELQARYSRRNQQKRQFEEEHEDTRLRESINLVDSRFEDIDKEPQSVQSVSYLEETQARREALRDKLLEENQEKREYYRDLRRRQVDDVERGLDSRSDTVSSLRDSRSTSSTLNFSRQNKPYVDLEEALNERFETTADRMNSDAREEYAKGPQETLRSEVPEIPGRASREKKYAEPQRERSELEEDYEPAKASRFVEKDEIRSEMDRLDDFQPESGVPPTEIYVKRN